jgi:hypothetical protein
MVALALSSVILYAPPMTSRPADSRSTPPSDPAWRAAEAYGCDMDLLEESLSLPPAERLRLHMIALRRLEQLEAALIRAKEALGRPHDLQTVVQLKAIRERKRRDADS